MKPGLEKRMHLPPTTIAVLAPALGEGVQLLRLIIRESAHPRTWISTPSYLIPSPTKQSPSKGACVPPPARHNMNPIPSRVRPRTPQRTLARLGKIRAVAQSICVPGTRVGEADVTGFVLTDDSGGVGGRGWGMASWRVWFVLGGLAHWTC